MAQIHLQPYPGVKQPECPHCSTYLPKVRDLSPVLVMQDEGKYLHEAIGLAKCPVCQDDLTVVFEFARVEPR